MKFTVLIFLASVWSVQAINWQPGDAGRIRWSWNCDYKGGDIANSRAKGEECGTLCLDHSSCYRFAWTDYEGGTCWLKSLAGELTESGSGICGELTFL